MDSKNSKSIQKPKVLYHASPNRKIDKFQPRSERPRSNKKEDLVFATPYKAVAAMFLAPRDIPAEIGKYNDEYAIFINTTEAKFRLVDHGGAIYTLPNATFETNREVGMREVEWTSKVSVKPICRVIYSSSFEAMKENGVQIYFVDDDMFAKIREDPSKALSWVKNI